MRHRAAAGFAGLVLALGLAAWRLSDSPAAAPAGPAAARVPVWVARVQASSASAPPTTAHATVHAAEAAEPKLSARAERMRADWCGYGAAEHERETDALLKRIEAANGTVGQAALAELGATDGARVLTEAREAVRRRWVLALRQRGDPRSLALADYLGPGDDAPAEEVAAANRRLQALARSSSDPMLTALALLRPCAAGTCVDVEGAQWSRLEPQNLQAWLALLKAVPDRRAELDYVMERMASQGQYSRTYEREAVALLLTLPQAESAGLQAEAEMQVLGSLAASWPIGNVSPITRACRDASAPAGRLERCEAIARVFWRGGDQLDRGIALGLARATIGWQPARRSAWEPQAREYEAVQAWMQQQWKRWRDLAAGEGGGTVCAGQLMLRRQLGEVRSDGEWAYAQRGMRAAGADEAALAAEWRRSAGRGALDPIQPASAAPR